MSAVHDLSLSRVDFGGLIKRVGGQARVDLVQFVGHVRQHRHVLGVRDQLGVVRPVVDVVDPLLGGLLVLRGVGDHHRVDERRAAGVRHHEFQVRIVLLQLDHVTRIRLGDNDIARREVVGVVVAGEPADLALVLLLLDQVDGLLHAFHRRDRPAIRPARCMIMPRPSCMSESRLILPLNAGSHRSSILVMSRPVAARL